MIMFFQAKRENPLGRENSVRRGPMADTFLWMTREEELAKKHEKSILRGKRVKIE